MSINFFIGYDSKEDIAYRVCKYSLLKRSSVDVKVMSLKLDELVSRKLYTRDIDPLASTQFTYSRFLVPYLMNYNGWWIYLDGDMVCLDDLNKLWSLRDERYALQVVKHNYKTKMSKKYWGSINENYPRKNWSSVILWNCSHDQNKCLTPKYVTQKSGAFLHRFKWLTDEEIGELDKIWNWLAIEYDENPNAKIVHYTLGTPCFKEFRNTQMSEYWEKYYKKLNKGHFKND